MKKIGIDARLYSQTGVGTYIRNLIYHLINEDTDNVLFYLYILPQDIDKLPKLPQNFIIRSSPFLWHTFREQIHFLFTILKDKLDLMHFVYFGFPILYWRPFISTIHDVTPIRYKSGKASTKNCFIYGIKLFIFKIVLFCQIRNSRTIITPSFTIKKDLIQLYGKKYEKKIIPIYEGVDYVLSQISENKLLSKDFFSPFFIYVGNFYPHKNMSALIHAFSILQSDSKLVLIGPKDYFTDQIQAEIVKFRLKDKVIFFHNASTADLTFFYKHAEALIHPSLSEGFGLPVLEARFFHCPVIASDLPIFHELIGSSALFFNPLDYVDIANKINLFIHEKNVDYSDKIDPKMSFKTMTHRILSLYQSNLNN